MNTFMEFLYKVSLFMNENSLLFTFVFVVGLTVCMYTVHEFIVDIVEKRERKKYVFRVVVSVVTVIYLLTDFVISPVVLGYKDGADVAKIDDMGEVLELSDGYKTVLSDWPIVYFAFEDGKFSDDEINAFKRIDSVMGTDSYKLLKNVEASNRRDNVIGLFRTMMAYDDHIQGVRKYLEGDRYDKLMVDLNDFVVPDLRTSVDDGNINEYEDMLFDLIKKVNFGYVIESDYNLNYDSISFHSGQRNKEISKLNKMLDGYLKSINEVDISDNVKNQLLIYKEDSMLNALDDGKIDEYETRYFVLHDELYGSGFISIVDELKEFPNSEVIKNRLNSEMDRIDLTLL